MKVTVLDDGNDKIVKILYGYHTNPVEWPSLKNIDLPEKFIDVTLRLSNCDGQIIIPGGEYLSDHHRSSYFGNDFCKSVLDRCIYKNVVVIRASGKSTSYDKWTKIIINSDHLLSLINQ